MTERTPQEWFQAAARCYLENHQGCPWCGGAHRVFRICREQQVAYYCNGCDFRVQHDEVTGDFHWIRGEDINLAKSTMYEI